MFWHEMRAVNMYDCFFAAPHKVCLVLVENIRAAFARLQRLASQIQMAEHLVIKSPLQPRGNLAGAVGTAAAGTAGGVAGTAGRLGGNLAGVVGTAAAATAGGVAGTAGGRWHRLLRLRRPPPSTTIAGTPAAVATATAPGTATAAFAAATAAGSSFASFFVGNGVCFLFAMATS